jgi:ABC-type branched-subunit amino acid transport system substrate-binding protein
MRISRAVALVSCVFLLTAVTGCGEPTTDESQGNYAGAYLYGADGNMSNPFGALFEKQPGLLAGMKGTRPMTPITEDFKARLQASEGRQMPDFNYAGEAYDAVMIAALAAQVAGTTDPKAIAAQMVGVTVGNDPCTSIASCMDKARTGQDVAYRGITVRSGFTQAGEPSTTSYGTVHFGPTNQLDQGKTEYLRAGNESSVSTQEPPKGITPGSKSGAPLVFGLLMTAPTATSVTSQARFAGAKLAFKDINALAGGVLGQPVKSIEGSDGAAAATAKAQIATHKAQGVHVLIGTSGSGVSAAVMGDVVNAGMVMISPSATAASLSTIDDKGFYFRTAPSDVLQARALADMIMRDGVRKVTLIGKNDAYGTGLVEGVQKELLAAGMNAASIQTLKFDIEGDKVKDPNQLSAIAVQVVANKPDGVLIVGTTESAEMIKALANGQLQIRH